MGELLEAAGLAVPCVLQVIGVPRSPPATCSKVPCDPPAHSSGCVGKHYQDECAAKCDAGYAGGGETTCQADGSKPTGKFSAECSPVPCDAPPHSGSGLYF